MYESDPVFQPIRIGNRTVENRFAIQSMEANDADSEGNPTERTYERYRRYFEGEAGLVDLEAITITDDSVSRNQQLSLLPRNQKALEKFVREMKAVNEKALFVFQITHSGQLSDPGFSKVVTVKPLPGFGGDLLTEDDVDRIIDRFVLGAKIAHDAGADGLDVKCCHGYLGSEITRPYNDRDWKYGRSFENRACFVFSIYERIGKEINDPDFMDAFLKAHAQATFDLPAFIRKARYAIRGQGVQLREDGANIRLQAKGKDELEVHANVSQAIESLIDYGSSSWIPLSVDKEPHTEKVPARAGQNYKVAAKLNLSW